MKSKNKIEINLIDFNKSIFGIRSEIQIGSYLELKKLQMKDHFFRIGITLITAFGCGMFFVFFILLYLLKKWRISIYLSLYSIISFLYLISFSGIFRDQQNFDFLSGGIHFLLRLLQDVTLFFLISIVLKVRGRYLICFFSFYAITIGIALASQMIFKFNNYVQYLSIIAYAAPLIMFPPIVGLITVMRFKHGFIHKLFFFLMVVIQGHDLLVFWQIVEDDFFVKWYIPFYLIYFSATFIYDSILDERKADEVREREDRARKMAHDIQSPLEALKVITPRHSFKNREESYIFQQSILRISEIAHELLENKKSGKKKGYFSLSVLIKEIIQNQSLKSSDKISFLSNLSFEDSFIYASEIQVYRSINNLINNAIEACSDSKEKVQVDLIREEDSVILIIEDNGTGMSTEVLARAKKGGFSTKNSGNGIGLKTSLDYLNQNQYEILISSQELQGTRVEIKFGLVEKPQCIVNKIEIAQNISTIVCIDNDLSFLELYERKFDGSNLKIVASRKPLDVSQFNLNETLFFIDYNLELEESGVDYIDKNDLGGKSFLVTSMKDSESLIKECIKKRIKFISKDTFYSLIVKNVEVKHGGVILIDDDKLIHKAWELVIKSKHKDVISFFSVDDFLDWTIGRTLDDELIIFIDSNLSQNLKGEVESRKIRNLGFKNLYLTTGSPKTSINKPSWIKEVLSKEIPWEIINKDLK